MITKEKNSIIEIKDRFKNLVKTEPLYKLAVTEKLTKKWYNTRKIRFLIAEEILDILKKMYEPLGLWKQNPRTKHKIDLGVVIDNDWSFLMQLDTNYSGYYFIFNYLNEYLVNIYKKENIEFIKIEDREFSYKDLMIFYETDDDFVTINKLRKQFRLLRHLKNEIFLIGKPIYENLQIICKTTMKWGDDAQDYYLKHINEFFDDIVSYTATKGKGDYDDRTKGIDVTKIHINRTTTDQIKSICNVIDKGDEYLMDVALSKDSKCDYLVFVCVDKKIMIFNNNDKTKINYTNDGLLISKDLLYKQIIYS